MKDLESNFRARWMNRARSAMLDSRREISFHLRETLLAPRSTMLHLSLLFSSNELKIHGMLLLSIRQLALVATTS